MRSVILQAAMLLGTCIALTSVICINISVYIFFIYISKSFTIIHESLLLYVNSIISLYSATFYFFNLLICLYSGISIFTFMLFYIEWAITTPIFIISLSHILKLPYQKMLLLSAADVLCMVAGGSMEIIPNPALKILPFSLGAMCYLGILIYLYTEYRKLNRVPIQSILYNNTITMYKCISIFIVTSWSFYPIVSALHNLGNISDETAIIVYSILDVLSKNIYSMIIYYYVLTINNIPHALDWFTRKKLKIVPLPIQDSSDSHATATSADSILAIV